MVMTSRSTTVALWVLIAAGAAVLAYLAFAGAAAKPAEAAPRPVNRIEVTTYYTQARIAPLPRKFLNHVKGEGAA